VARLLYVTLLSSRLCRPPARAGHENEREVRYAISSLSFSQEASQFQGMKPTHFVIDQEISVAK
jgi:hypothetical protein